MPAVRAVPEGQVSFWCGLGEGLSALFRDARLRAIAACDATLNFFAGITDAVRALFFVQVLHPGAAFCGLMFSVERDPWLWVGFAARTTRPQLK